MKQNRADGVLILSLSLPNLHTPSNYFSPSLISPVVSVDVEHHAYILSTETCTQDNYFSCKQSRVMQLKSHHGFCMFVSNPFVDHEPSLL